MRHNNTGIMRLLGGLSGFITDAFRLIIFFFSLSNSCVLLHQSRITYSSFRSKINDLALIFSPREPFFFSIYIIPLLISGFSSHLALNLEIWYTPLILEKATTGHKNLLALGKASWTMPSCQGVWTHTQELWRDGHHCYHQDISITSTMFSIRPTPLLLSTSIEQAKASCSHRHTVKSKPSHILIFHLFITVMASLLLLQ